MCLKKLTLEDYEIFFKLREMYPTQCELIAELMRCSFANSDSFSSKIYLNGIFDEKDVKFIFEKLNLQLNVAKVIPAPALRSKQFTIVDLTLQDSKKAV